MNRKKATFKNLTYAFAGQFLGMISLFISRVFFLKILSSEYLGINGLFSNILTVLSFAELGFGTAITYSLYKPLAENNISKIKAYMNLFKKIYFCVGISIILIGSCITPFIKLFINEMPDIPNINFIYFLYVLNTGISYFLSYKKTLIIANQKRYIVTFYRYLCYVLVNIFQIIGLYIFRSYIVYMLIQIFFTVLENILVTLKANKMYPYLLKNNEKLNTNSKKEIFKNTRAMMMHKVGSIAINSTDNIILAKMVGLTSVGIYSNYLIIKQALISVTGQIYNSLSAGIGNLCAEETNLIKRIDVFNKLNFISFTIYSFTSICLLNLIKPFISLWIGNEYLISNLSTIVFIIIYYLTGMRNPVLTYRESLGLFYKDRYKALIEAIVNLILSIWLAPKFEILGVLLGTLISMVTVSIWVEVYILYKYGFKSKVEMYYKDYFEYLIFTFIMSLISYAFCSIIKCKIIFVEIIIRLVISITIYCAFMLGIAYKKGMFEILNNG